MRYPLIETALERHLGWARDFARAGDVDAAVDAIRDAHATFGELRSSEPPGAVVTASRSEDHGALAELEAIAERSADAADAGLAEADLLEAYESLRQRATSLALAQGWATAEQLADQFPSAQALREIERLDLAFGAEFRPALAPDRGMAARLSEALVALAAWATGVRVAHGPRDG